MSWHLKTVMGQRLSSTAQGPAAAAETKCKGDLQGRKGAVGFLRFLRALRQTLMDQLAPWAQPATGILGEVDAFYRIIVIFDMQVSDL